MESFILFASAYARFLFRTLYEITFSFHDHLLACLPAWPHISFPNHFLKFLSFLHLGIAWKYLTFCGVEVPSPPCDGDSECDWHYFVVARFKYVRNLPRLGTATQEFQRQEIKADLK